MIRIQKVIMTALLLLLMSPLQAAEVSGVKLSDQVRVAEQDLVLNGAGLRKKYFVKVYVAGLYLPQKTSQADEAVSMQGARQITMHFLRDVDAEKITAGWTEGFQNNSQPGDMQQLSKRLAEFNSQFDAVKAGDEVTLQYVPGLGTRVVIAGAEKEFIPGRDFMQALMRVWLGDTPADSDLKKAFLGQD